MKPSILFNKYMVPAVLVALLLAPASHADEPARPADESSEPTTNSPWGFNLTTYLWMAGIKGNLSAGPFSRSIDSSFIDIVTSHDVFR